MTIGSTAVDNSGAANRFSDSLRQSFYSLLVVKKLPVITILITLVIVILLLANAIRAFASEAFMP